MEPDSGARVNDRRHGVCWRGPARAARLGPVASSATFTFQVELQHNYQPKMQGKIVIGQIEYETLEHVVLKFLGWCVFYHERLAIEKKIDDLFEPDLVLQGYDGTVHLWVECGKVSIHKLNKLTKRYPGSRIYVLLASERDARQMAEQIRKKVDKPAAIRLVAFTEDVVGTFLPTLMNKNEVWCNLSWPENIEDAVAADVMEMEMTMNGSWIHCPLSVTKMAG